MIHRKRYNSEETELSGDRREIRSGFLKLLLLFCFLVIIIFPVIYSFSSAWQSDYVEDLIWADTAIRAGRLLNPDFIYPYAIPFGGNLFMLPFVLMFGAGQLANSCGMVLFYLVFLGTGVLFFTSFTKDRMKILAGLAILALAFRSEVGANQLHHILYYQLGNICLLGILAGLFYCFLQKDNRKSILCLILYGVWAGANGPVTIVLSVVPVFLVLVYLLIVRNGDKKRIFRFALYLIGVIVLGLGLYFFSTRGIQESNYLENTGSYSFQGIETWFENLSSLPKHWFKLFVLYGPEGNRITTINGIETLVSIGWACFIGLFPLLFVKKLSSGRCTEAERLSFIVDIAVWCICLMQYVFFRNDGEHRIRVLFNGVLVHFILLAVWFTERYTFGRNDHSVATKSILNKTVVLFAIFTLMAGYSAWFVAKAEWGFDSGIIELLQDRGLKYGFGTYWNAHINTVNSNGKVIVRPVDVSNGNVRSMKYQCEDSWYLPDQIDEEEKWFILLEQSEWENMDGGINKTAMKLAEEDISINGYHILIYSADLWDDIIQGKRFVYNFSNDTWQIGCETSQGGRMIPDGAVSFGPYIPVPEGSIVHVRITGNELTHAAFNAYENNNDNKILIENLIVSNDMVSFDFVLEQSVNNLEISVTNPAGDDFSDNIQLYTEEIIID